MQQLSEGGSPDLALFHPWVFFKEKVFYQVNDGLTNFCDGRTVTGMSVHKDVWR